MTRALLLGIFLMAGCEAHTRTPGALLDPLGDRHPGRERAVAAVAVPPTDHGKVQYFMRRRFHDLREMHAMLAHGRLDEAKALAFMVSRPVDDPRLAVLAPESERAVTAALALAKAGSAEEARRLAPRLVAACTGCHQRAGVEVTALDALQPKALALGDQRLE